MCQIFRLGCQNNGILCENSIFTYLKLVIAVRLVPNELLRPLLDDFRPVHRSDSHFLTWNVNMIVSVFQFGFIAYGVEKCYQRTHAMGF